MNQMQESMTNKPEVVFIEPFGEILVLEPWERRQLVALHHVGNELRQEAEQILRNARLRQQQASATSPLVPGPVRPGQVWTDGDPTSTRRITVEGLDREHALCRSSRGNLQVRIRLNRFVPGTRGYRLVQDAPAE